MLWNIFNGSSIDWTNNNLSLAIAPLDISTIRLSTDWSAEVAMAIKWLKPRPMNGNFLSCLPRKNRIKIIINFLNLLMLKRRNLNCAKTQNTMSIWVTVSICWNKVIWCQLTALNANAKKYSSPKITSRPHLNTSSQYQTDLFSKIGSPRNWMPFLMSSKNFLLKIFSFTTQHQWVRNWISARPQPNILRLMWWSWPTWVSAQMLRKEPW